MDGIAAPQFSGFSSSSVFPETTSISGQTKNVENGNVQNKEDLNILFLSEIGVGKWKFINDVSNYLAQDRFERAQKAKYRVTIPAIFQIDDKSVKRATDKNEFLRAGDSPTQYVKSYVFPIENNHPNIRIIDTPELGDTTKPEQDQKKCDYILNYISNLEKLHAICCLFKLSETNNTKFFRSCITEILSRLDKSVGRNIIFLFTTRETNYVSGEIYDILKKTLDEIGTINNVEVPQKENVFCFNNEALLGGQRSNAFVDDKKYRQHWKNEFWR